MTGGHYVPGVFAQKPPIALHLFLFSSSHTDNAYLIQQTIIYHCAVRPESKTDSQRLTSVLFIDIEQSCIDPLNHPPRVPGAEQGEDVYTERSSRGNVEPVRHHVSHQHYHIIPDSLTAHVVSPDVFVREARERKYAVMAVRYIAIWLDHILVSARYNLGDPDVPDIGIKGFQFFRLTTQNPTDHHIVDHHMNECPLVNVDHYTGLTIDAHEPIIKCNVG